MAHLHQWQRPVKQERLHGGGVRWSIDCVDKAGNTAYILSHIMHSSALRYSSLHAFNVSKVLSQTVSELAYESTLSQAPMLEVPRTGLCLHPRKYCWDKVQKSNDAHL